MEEKATSERASRHVIALLAQIFIKINISRNSKLGTGSKFFIKINLKQSLGMPGHAASAAFVSQINVFFDK